VEFWWKERRLLRIPYFWEDDLEMERPRPCWQLNPLLQIGQGLKVFGFHPIHIYLNSTNMKSYQMLKRRVPKLFEAIPSEVDCHVYTGLGTNSLFTEIVEQLALIGQSKSIRDIISVGNFN
jgi:hypothetical protein